MNPPTGPESGEYQYRALTRGNAIQRAWHRSKISLALRLLDPSPRDRILDAGCGSGIVSSALGGAGARVAALDCNLDAVRFARDHCRFRGALFVAGRIQELPFRPGSFDKACCTEVMEHFPPEETGRAVAELHRVLTSGGVLLLTTPNYGSAWPCVEWIVNRAKSVSRVRADAHTCRMDAASLARLAVGGGFTIDRLGSFNHLSPFAAVFSERLGARLLNLEIERGDLRGNLLFCLCRKPAGPAGR